MIDTSLNVATVLLIGFVVLWAAVWCFARRRDRRLLCSVSSLGRGTKAERKLIVRLRKEGVHPAAIFHDLYVRKGNGEYSQIDIVVACPQGLIVIEVKDYSGWLFGRENQVYWTQVLNYGKEKYRFYNPLMQNAGHIQAIRQCLPQNPGIPIYSVIVFFGSSEFKNVTCHADDTFIIYPRSIRRVVRGIMMQPDAKFGNKHEIMDLFTGAVANGNDPVIVSSQISSAAYYGRNTPRSAYAFPFGSLLRFLSRGRL